MRLIFVDESWKDYFYWQKTAKRMLKRIKELIKNISRTLFSDIGKPEPLKHRYQGYWSMRIDSQHRLIYQVNDGNIIIAKCGFHYD